MLEKILHGEAASVLAEENSLTWTGGDNSLMTHIDYLTHAMLKIFIKEKEFYLQQGLHAHEIEIPAVYFLKRFNAIRQPFALHKLH